jgi:ABC-type polysaccharide/polyol phosphate transport system ATPase subunit
MAGASLTSSGRLTCPSGCGECLGLIGRNGAGATLIKMLNGLIKPDKGSIAVRGRAGELIVLGAGFSPILTRCENRVYQKAVGERRKAGNR